MLDLAIPTSPEEKLHFMQRWYRWFYENTDNWQGKIGQELAYLWGAIMNDTFIIINSQSAILSLLREKRVDSRSTIWKYVRYPDN